MVARSLTICLLAYAAASLLHHMHNAEFLADYPNMPAWLTREKVYLVWLGEASIGAVGYVLVRIGYRSAGLLLIGLYALMGFAGLDHYTVAPFSTHTATMHFTIALEVVAAAFLLFTVALKWRTTST